MSPGRDGAAVDTVVLRYFLAVDAFDLLAAVLGEPLVVSSVVYDPEEGEVPETAMSEITRSIRVQTRMAEAPDRPPAERNRAATLSKRLAGIHRLHKTGRIVVEEMTKAEQTLMARLVDPSEATTFGLKLPLDDGEAATLALAATRGLVLATDDSDALRALRSIASGHPYQRTRRLLITAVDQGSITREQANALHAEMRAFGFWDTGVPFPETG